MSANIIGTIIGEGPGLNLPNIGASPVWVDPLDVFTLEIPPTQSALVSGGTLWTIADADDAGLQGSAPHIVAWVKSTSVSGSEVLFSKMAGSVRRLVVLRRSTTELFEVQGGGASGQRATGSLTDGIGVITEDTWQLVAMGIDTSALTDAKRARFFQSVRRAFRTLTSSTDPTAASGADIQIADSSLAGDTRWNGNILAIATLSGPPLFSELNAARELGPAFDLTKLTNVLDVYYPRDVSTPSEVLSRSIVPTGSVTLDADVPAADPRTVYSDSVLDRRVLFFDQDRYPWCLTAYDDYKVGIDDNIFDAWNGRYMQDPSVLVRANGDRWYNFSQGASHASQGRPRSILVKVPRTERDMPLGLPAESIIQIDRTQYVQPDLSRRDLTATEALALVHPTTHEMPSGLILRVYTQFLFDDGDEQETVVIVEESRDAGQTYTPIGRISWGERRTVNGLGFIDGPNGGRYIPVYKVDDGSPVPYSCGLWFLDKNGVPQDEPATLLASGVPGVTEPSECCVGTLRDGTHFALIREDRTLPTPELLAVKTPGANPLVWGEPFTGPAGNAFPFWHQATDGTIVAISRGDTPVGSGAEGLPILSFSVDNGLTWSAPTVFGNASGSWFMGGVIEEFATNRLRLVWCQDVDPGGDQNSAYTQGYIAELAYAAWHD